MCESEGGKPIEGFATYCSLENTLRYMEGNITVTYFTGQEITRHFQGEMEFNAPPKIEHISFNVFGIDKNDRPVCLTTEFDYHYFTAEAYEQRQEKYTLYGLLLVLVSLIAVPLCVFVTEKILT